MTYFFNTNKYLASFLVLHFNSMYPLPAIALLLCCIVMLPMMLVNVLIIYTNTCLPFLVFSHHYLSPISIWSNFFYLKNFLQRSTSNTLLCFLFLLLPPTPSSFFSPFPSSSSFSFNYYTGTCNDSISNRFPPKSINCCLHIFQYIFEASGPTWMYNWFTT